MSRRNILPTYLSSPAWGALCDAIDYVFNESIDTPTENLGKLRESWLFNQKTNEDSLAALLISPGSLDTFERTVLLRQLNTLGFSLRNPDVLSDEQITRLVRYLPVYWYSKGKIDLADFLSYALGTTITMTRMWTQDYKTFLTEGDPNIGALIFDKTLQDGPTASFVARKGDEISPPSAHFTAFPTVATVPASVEFTDTSIAYVPNTEVTFVPDFTASPNQGIGPLTVKFTDTSESLGFPDPLTGKIPLSIDFTDTSVARIGGPWYPTTHTTIEVDLLKLSPEFTLEAFGSIFADLANYPLVLYYVVSASEVYLNSSSGAFIPVALTELKLDNEFISNEELTSDDTTQGNGGGGFTPIHTIAIPGLGGSNYVPPPIPVADFTAMSVIGLTANPNTLLGMAPFEVHFKDLSVGPRVYWEWYFTNKLSSESSQMDPVFVFEEAGLYDVILRAGGFNGSTGIEKSQYIQVSPTHPAALLRLHDHSTDQQFVANFELTPADLTSAFGGGGYSPILTISIPGPGGINYLPRVRVPVASFTTDVTSGVSPFTVTFTDTSSDAPETWSWSFETSDVDSYDQNPVYTFSNAGSYSVALLVSNEAGTNRIVRTNLITVTDPFLNDVPLYIPGHGPNNGTIINEFDNYPVTRVGNPVTSTVQFTFGSSVYFSGNGYLRVARRNELNMVSKVFTLETFLTLPSLGKAVTVMDFRGENSSAASGWVASISAAGFPTLFDGVGNKTIVSNLVVPTNASVHVAFLWNGTQAYFAVNGVLSTKTTWSGPTATDTTGVLVGASRGQSNSPVFYLSEIRLTNGVRYPVNFQVPTQVFPNPIIKPPVASFTVSDVVGVAPKTITFTSTSTDKPLLYSWDFNGDNVSDSTQPVASFVFNTAGSFTPKLTAFNTGGSSVSIASTPIVITLPPMVVTNFTASAIIGAYPLTTVFTDTSTNSPTSWMWDFGDGTTSTLRNPSKTYSVQGVYSVTLTASNFSGPVTLTKTNFITVTVPIPVASFTATPILGAIPLSTTFTDTSTNNPTSWLWEFGDGTTSTLRNPSKTYALTGSYTVSLTATSAGGSNTKTSTGFINATDVRPVADFIFSPSTGQIPLIVNFTNTTPGVVTSWLWNFGDGTTSTAQHPTKTYSSSGTFTVTLTATNSGGSNTKTTAGAIVILAITPVASFTSTPNSGNNPLTVTFTDTSTNSPTSWLWDFGDGTTSTLKNP